MIFVVLIPAWVWTIVIAAIWGALFYKAIFRLGLRLSLMNGLLVVLGLQSIAAVSAAIVTSVDQISAFACLTGIYGSLSFPVIILLELVALAFLYRMWPMRDRGKKIGFFSWLSIWVTFNIAVFFVFLRSALLCTV